MSVQILWQSCACTALHITTSRAVTTSPIRSLCHLHCVHQETLDRAKCAPQLREICTHLAEDMAREDLRGKTVTLKLKSAATFEVGRVPDAVLRTSSWPKAGLSEAMCR